jgi:hypothetical protein
LEGLPVSSSQQRRSRSYSPIPIPADPEPLDVSVGQMMWFGDWSQRQTFRLIESGEVETFVFGGKRRIIFESLKQYRARCIAKGPQRTPRFRTGKRPVGRPRKAS